MQCSVSPCSPARTRKRVGSACLRPVNNSTDVRRELYKLNVPIRDGQQPQPGSWPLGGLPSFYANQNLMRAGNMFKSCLAWSGIGIAFGIRGMDISCLVVVHVRCMLYVVVENREASLETPDFGVQWRHAVSYRRQPVAHVSVPTPCSA